MLALRQVVVVQEGHEVARGGGDAGVRGRRAAAGFGQLDALHVQPEIGRQRRRLAAVVDQHDLDAAVAAAIEAAQRLGEKLRPVASPNHHRHHRPVFHDQLFGHATEMADERAQAAGAQIRQLQAPVPFGGSRLRRQREGAEAAQTARRRQVGMALLLAGIAGHRLLEDRQLGADVHQQVGILGMVDLVEQEAWRPHFLQLLATQRRVDRVNRREDRAVIRGDLEWRRHEQQVRPLSAPGAPQSRGEIREVGRQAAIRQSQHVEPGHSEHRRRRPRLGEPARRVGGALLASRVTPAVAGEEHPHHGAPRHELHHQPAAAKNFVVVVRRHDEHAARAHALAAARRQGRGAHRWMYPRACRRFTVSGSSSACRSRVPRREIQKRSAGPSGVWGGGSANRLFSSTFPPP